MPLGPRAVPDEHSWPRAVISARTFGEPVEWAAAPIVLHGASDPAVAAALRHLTASLRRLDLDDADRAHVDTSAASLEPAGTD